MTQKTNLARRVRMALLLVKRGAPRFLSPQTLLRVFAIVLLMAIWGGTALLISSEREAAAERARAASHRLADTYEAQVVRALREIEQTMRFVEYVYRSKGNGVLADLQEMDLLPSSFWFTVTIADRQGNVIASSGAPGTNNVANEEYFQRQLVDNVLFVSRPMRTSASAEWKIHFSRRLQTVDGRFAGVQFITVHSSYFVAGYDTALLGSQAVLAITGNDGYVRARRTGERVSAGDQLDYAGIVAAGGDDQMALWVSPWDKIPRYFSVRELYGFPLAVIVGLSADEHLAAVRDDTLAYRLVIPPFLEHAKSRG